MNRIYTGKVGVLRAGLHGILALTGLLAFVYGSLIGLMAR